MTGDDPLAEPSGSIETGSAWRIDRRRFLQVAGATGLAAFAGSVALPRDSRATSVAEAVGGATVGIGATVEQLAQALEYDPDAIFRFVADKIRYEPYAGVLRGATGTLWAGSGNSADQALLLAALLDEALVPHRFVSGPITDATAGTLLAASQIDVAAVHAEAQASLLGGILDTSILPSPNPSPDASAQAFLSQAEATREAFMATATAQLQDGIDTITLALGSAGITVAGAAPALPQRERDQHVWLQLGSGPEWIDLDATMPGSQGGQTVAQAGVPMVALPDDARHRIEFDVIAETVVSGKLQQDVIFQHTEFADSLVGVPVAYFNAKPEGLKGLGVSLAGTLTGSVQYLPVLIVGDSSTGGKTPITFSTQGGANSAFGTPGDFEGETTAQWLQVSVFSPDKPAAVAKRTIFDRVGEDVRASGSFSPASLTEVTLTDLDAGATREYVPCVTLHVFAVLGGPVSGGVVVQPPATDDPIADVARFGAFYHFIRAGLAAEVGAPHGVRAFSDAPTIVSYTFVPGAPAAAGDFNIAAALDIWHRSFGLASVPGTPQNATPGVVAGVLSHVAERLTMGEGLPVDPAAPPSPPLSVGRIFDEAKRQGIAAKALQGAGAEAGLAYPAAALIRLGDELRAGYTAVLPERPVDVDGGAHVGWWLVDPATGRTLDELEDGRGGIVEYFELNAALLTEALKIVLRRLFACVAKYAIYAALLIEFSNQNLLPTSVAVAMNAVGIAGSSVSTYSAFACA